MLTVCFLLQISYWTSINVNKIISLKGQQLLVYSYSHSQKDTERLTSKQIILNTDKISVDCRCLFLAADLARRPRICLHFTQINITAKWFIWKTQIKERKPFTTDEINMYPALNRYYTRFWNMDVGVYTFEASSRGLWWFECARHADLLPLSVLYPRWLFM